MNDRDTAQFHDRTRHFARMVLAVTNDLYVPSFIRAESISDDDYTQVLFWLTCLAANGITVGDRLEIANRIIDLYFEQTNKISNIDISAFGGNNAIAVANKKP